MATSTPKADKADETKVDAKANEVKDTSETVPAGSVTTTEKPAEAPAKVEPIEDKSDEDREDVFESDFEDELPGSLGTVQENGYDVPWTYLTGDHFGEAGYKARTADADDEDVVKWNVQHTFESGNEDDEVVALVPVAATPGQTFTVDELPDYDGLVAAGIDPVQFLSGLPVRASISDGEVPRRGIPA